MVFFICCHNKQFFVEIFVNYHIACFNVVMYNMFVGILHAVGDSRHPLYYLIASSLTNVVLDLLFVAVLQLGVWAAALATTISQGLSATLCLLQLMRVREPYKLELKKIRYHGNSFRQIIRYGLPSGIQNSVITECCKQ